MTGLLKVFGLIPNESEQLIIDQLKKNQAVKSMRVVGRGTLTKSTKQARNSQRAKDFIKSAEDLIK